MLRALSRASLVALGLALLVGSASPQAAPTEAAPGDATLGATAPAGGALEGAASGDAATSFSGVASWYGPEFAGRRTSNGEVYDPTALTAAHRSLPFGSYVLVRNLDSGASVVVRINDRGPFARDRVIDLSEAAAQLIGMIPTGTARVTCSVVPPQEALAWNGVDPASQPATRLGAPGSKGAAAPPGAAAPGPSAAGPKSSASGPTHVRIQVASYGSAANAQATLVRLQNSGLEAVIERKDAHFRVVFPDLAPEQARRVLELLDDLGYRSLLVTSW